MTAKITEAIERARKAHAKDKDGRMIVRELQKRMGPRWNGEALYRRLTMRVRRARTAGDADAIRKAESDLRVKYPNAALLKP